MPTTSTPTADPVLAHQYKQSRPDPWHLQADELDALRFLRVRLFGVLADLAFPVVEHYRSDVMHDVHWIDEHVTTTEPRVFYYGADGWGTAIGEDEQYVRCSRDRVWEVRVVNDVGEFSTNISIFTAELEAS